MAEAVDPTEYELEVKRVAVCMARCRKMEKGGELHEGWFDARSDLLKALKRACAQFEGMDFDIMDDAAQLVIDRARRAKNG